MMNADKQADALGRLESVPIRECWKHEAQDFTPWLAEEKNLALLSEATGMELELEEQESHVGDFRTDLVCHDLDGQLVIVENQFGKTDHDHLGKCLTYAAGKDAKALVWIAEDFRDEHRAALDWLNEQTSDDIHVFGVEIELWKIGDSAPAPKFNVVSRPNDWTETIRHSGEMNETQKLRLKFWTGLRDVMEQRKGKVKPTAPSPDNWKTFSIGAGHFHLDAVMNVLQNRIAVQLIMDGKAAKAHYHLLHEQKVQVEKEMGLPLEWRELPTKKQKKVNLWRENCDLKNKGAWGDCHAWLQKYLEKFYAVFHQRIQDLNPDDWPSEDVQDEDNIR